MVLTQAHNDSDRTSRHMAVVAGWPLAMTSLLTPVFKKKEAEEEREKVAWETGETGL